MERTDLSAMVGDLLALGRDNHLSMPPDQAMLLKVFVSLEGAFKKLDPAFDMMVAIRPTLHEALLKHFSPNALGRRGLKVLTQYLELFADLPKEILRGIQTVKSGNLKVRIDLNQLENFQKHLTRASNRLAVSAITSAMVVGTSIIVAFGRGATLAGVDLYNSFGIGAIIGGALILFSIWRDKS
jgi:ubiquinone biosynthesis protein